MLFPKLSLGIQRVYHLSLSSSVFREHAYRRFSKPTAFRSQHGPWKLRELPPPTSIEAGRSLGFPKSPSIPPTEQRSETHVCAIFFLNQRSLLADCFLFEKPTFPSKPATSLEWQAMESNVTLNCPLLRHFLLSVFQMLYKKQLCYLALAEPSCERQPFPYLGHFAFKGALLPSAPSGPVKGPPGKLLLLCLKSAVAMPPGARRLINSSCLEISNRLLRTLISCFNILSFRIGSKSLSVVCWVLNLHLDKKIKIVLSEYLSISIIRNARHRGLGWRSCVSGRFYALHLSLPKNCCHYMAHKDLRHSLFMFQTDQFNSVLQKDKNVCQEPKVEKLWLCYWGLQMS